MEKLEEIRKKLINRYIISIILAIITAIILMVLTEFFVIAAFGALAVWCIFLLIATSKLSKNYKKMFKDIFVLESLKNIFTDLTYTPEKGMPYGEIASTKMMNMGDRYHSEDYVSGKYKDINFEQADVHIEEEYQTTDSEGHTHTEYVTIFRGRWMIFDFNKEFKANVQISQKGFSGSYVKKFFGKKEELFKKVSMESETFNKRFNVFAQNEHDAFYIITPSLMEKIERLDDNNKGKLLFCFVNNRLHIAINDGKDSFEPGSVFKKIDKEKILDKISSEIETITQFIDELNLDNDLFKKEV